MYIYTYIWDIRKGGRGMLDFILFLFCFPKLDIKVYINVSTWCNCSKDRQNDLKCERKKSKRTEKKIKASTRLSSFDFSPRPSRLYANVSIYLYVYVYGVPLPPPVLIVFFFCLTSSSVSRNMYSMDFPQRKGQKKRTMLKESDKDKTKTYTHTHTREREREGKSLPNGSLCHSLIELHINV